MSKQGRIGKALAVILAFVAGHPSADANQPSARTPISVADLVREAIVGDPNSLTWNSFANQVSTPSPDGKWVAVVVRRGDPELRTNNADLLVYRTADLLKAQPAQVVATFATATKYQPIALVRWLADSQTLIFAGTQSKQLSQVYRADLRTKEVKQLTQLEFQLLSHEVTASGEWLATVSETPPAGGDSDCRQRPCLVSADTLQAAQHGGGDLSGSVTLHELRSGRGLRTLQPPEATDPDLVECRNELKGGISPDGRFGLRICKFRRHHWPAWWEDYIGEAQQGKTLAEGHNGYLRQWVLYDFERGTSSRLTSAPYFIGHYRTSAPLWIDNGRHLLIAGASEPLQDVKARERAKRASRYSIVLIDPITRETTRIGELDPSVMQVTSASWDEEAQLLTVDSVDAANKTLPTVTYRRSGTQWAALARRIVPAARDAAPRLAIRQSLNEPALLVATDPRTGTTSTVLDPNPWLAERTLGRVEAIAWKSKDGREWNGGLYYPPEYRRGERYPLVLQTHGFRADTFALYGIARNFVAQPLAAHGMLVLQIEENTKGVSGADLWPVVQAGYEAAIDHLDGLGLIDRRRVGIQGWSITGPYTGYTLTHSQYEFAAGAFTETADIGWWYYMLLGAGHSETQYGVPPFGKGLDVWRTMSPTFNLERVRTPMLMSGEITGLWDWYVGLRRLGKPVEYWALPDPTHDIFKVDDRLLMNQLLVDWFRFWLKHEEDSSPTKAQQYARWRALRQQQNRTLSRASQQVTETR